MTRPKGQPFTPKRAAAIKLCYADGCYAAMYNNTHKCPVCGTLTQAGRDAIVRKSCK